MEIKLKQIERARFNVYRPSCFELKDTIDIICQIENIKYAMEVPMEIKSETFGKINIKDFTDRELIIGGILATLQKEYENAR